MSIRYRFLEASDESQYQEFIDKCDNALFYHSLKYKVFLEKILNNSVSRYLLAIENRKIVAALPMFVLKTESGVVVNSLPFFGSHGSVIALANTQTKIKEELVQRYLEFCNSIEALSGTIISNLVNPDLDLLDKIKSDYQEFRTGQITFLPPLSSEIELGISIMSVLHSKTRNSIRKGLKSGLVFQIDDSPRVLLELYHLHCDNIRLLKGIPKPLAMFEEVSVCFKRSEDYEVFTARTKSGQLISGLLVFYFKDWVEYFVPATKEQYRSMQPLSALIYLAMKHSILHKSSRRWNWGGTWPSQKDVYFFKSRWGSIDFPYKYFTREFSKISIKDNFCSDDLLKTFNYFYSIPFSELKT
jgi:hypothetical protein